MKSAKNGYFRIAKKIQKKKLKKLSFLFGAVIHQCHVPLLEDGKKRCKCQDYEDKRDNKTEDCDILIFLIVEL